MIDITTSTPPQSLLTADEAYQWLGLSPELFEQESVLTLISSAVTDYIQKATGCRVFPESWSYELGCFPPRAFPIAVPLKPVTAITEIRYLDTDGNQQTFAGAEITGSQRQVLVPPANTFWPTTAAWHPGNVQLTLAIGEPTPPPWAQIAARELAELWFDLRSGVSKDPQTPVPFSLQSLLRQNRIPDHFVEYAPDA